MLKSLSHGFSRFFTTERVIILVVFLILVWALLQYSGSKSLRVDNMETGTAATAAPSLVQPVATPAAPAAQVTPATPVAPAGQSSPNNYNSALGVSPKDLLPQDQNSQWAALNPVSQGNIAAPDLLQAGYHIGLDTIGQTLRNANLQERSDPIIPKSAVGPWNQSTIEPDLGRVPLEVGVGSR